MATKNKFIMIELDLAEEQLSIYKSWLLANPYDGFVDRIQWKETKGGGAMPLRVATIEAQQKNHRETMKDYLSLLDIVKKLREVEAKKVISTRGDIDIPDIMNR